MNARPRAFTLIEVLVTVTIVAILAYDTASFYYDHALDLVTGLTEGRAPARGGDPSTMFPTRMVTYGFNAEAAR